MIQSSFLAISLSLIAQSNWIPAMEAARNKSDWAQMEWVCQAAVDRGLREEYLLRSLSWAQRKQSKTAAALANSKLNWRINPCAWSLVDLIQAEKDDGNIPEAVAAAKHLLANQREWGSISKTCESTIQSVSTLTYEITWKISDHENKGIEHGIPIPQQDPYIQTKVTCSVKGAKSWEERTNSDGIKYVQGIHFPGQPFYVTCQVTIAPFSWKPLLSKATDAAAPASLAPLLGKSDYRKKLTIDPTAPLAKSLAQTLKGKNHAETAANVIAYVTKNIPWTDIPENGTLTSEGCLQLGKGSCTPRSFAAIAILRAAGIPSRAIRGHSAISPSNPHASAHTIPQFYLPGLGWVDADFDHPMWVPRTNFLRMYYRVSISQGLGDAMDPAKDCHVRLIASKL